LKKELHINLIRAYFTHSYRASDRDVNLFFWQLCLEGGISLVVDPKATQMSLARLERLIQRTSATIGVVPKRSEEPYYLCSPYSVLEYGLAVQARVPTLLFLEDTVAGRFFDSQSGGVVSFNRERLVECRQEARAALRALKKRISGPRKFLGGPLGTVALLASSKSNSTFDENTVRAISEVTKRLGFAFQRDDLTFELPHMLVQRLDKYDVVLVDVNPESEDRWVLPYIYARSVPAIRLYKLLAQGSVPDQRDFLDIVASQMLLERSAADEIVLFWRANNELTERLEDQLTRFRQVHTELYPEINGERYLRSAGRSDSEARVFISNAHDSDDLAQSISNAMYLANIEHFQYRAANDIPVGSVWIEHLERKVRECRVFVALLTRAYLASEWCQRELEIAKSNPDSIVLPFFLDPDLRMDGLPRQGRLIKAQGELSVHEVVSDVENVISNPRSSASDLIATTASGDDIPPIDVLIMSIKDEEYQAVLNTLDAHTLVKATVDRPNLFSWEHGVVQRSSDKRPFHLIVGIVGNQGQTPMTDAVKESIRVWRPTICLIVGIAGGLPKWGLSLGDVVLSTEIWHYELGRLDREFHPSMRRVYQVNGPLLTAALTLHAQHPGWAQSLGDLRPGVGEPRVFSGVIASGNMVVQNMDSPIIRPMLELEPNLLAIEMEGGGGAAAVHNLQQQELNREGFGVGFFMIRGISDVIRSADSDHNLEDQSGERYRWTLYASASAATYAIELIRRRWPFAPRS